MGSMVWMLEMSTDYRHTELFVKTLFWDQESQKKYLDQKLKIEFLSLSRTI